MVVSCHHHNLYLQKLFSLTFYDIAVIVQFFADFGVHRDGNKPKPGCNELIDIRDNAACSELHLNLII